MYRPIQITLLDPSVAVRSPLLFVAEVLVYQCARCAAVCALLCVVPSTGKTANASDLSFASCSPPGCLRVHPDTDAVPIIYNEVYGFALDTGNLPYLSIAAGGTVREPRDRAGSDCSFSVWPTSHCCASSSGPSGCAARPTSRKTSSCPA